MSFEKAALALALAITFSSTWAQGCYQSIIVSPSPFLGNNGEIFKLSDGSIWEVRYEYQYLYAYNPSIIICPDKGKLSIDSKILNVTQVGSSKDRLKKSAPSAKKNNRQQSSEDVVQAGDDLIESQIEGDFKGWEGETIFKLSNGQIWQQSSYDYTYHYSYRPKITIVRVAEGHRMAIEGIDRKIMVKRID
jgi:hypothetical protein